MVTVPMGEFVLFTISWPDTVTTMLFRDDEVNWYATVNGVPAQASRVRRVWSKEPCAFWMSPRAELSLVWLLRCLSKIGIHVCRFCSFSASSFPLAMSARHLF